MSRLILMVFIFLLVIFSACSNDMKEVDALMSGNMVEKEVATDVEIFYSDSALVKIKISAPRMVRYLEKSAPNEEFPEGLVVEFYNDKEEVYSRLKADYGLREVLKKQIVTRKNVEMTNNKKERLLSSELIWVENEEILFTQKFVMIIQPESNDTITGFGFRANQDFTRFEIMKRGSASLNIEQLKADLEEEK